MDKMYLALIISAILALLIFRQSYTSNLKVYREKYTEDQKFNYSFLILDILTAISFAVIGCYLAWDALTTIQALNVYEEYKFLGSICNGVVFQQVLPIVVEYVLNKINLFKQENLK